MPWYVVTLLDTFIWIGTALFTIALIPQLIRTLKLGRAEDFSLPFIAMIWFASVFTCIYWYARGEYVAMSGFIANIIVWAIIWYYRLYPRPEAIAN